MHYLSLKDTYKCISSINQSCKGSNYNIVVVDNASPNSSGNVLKNKYRNNPQINVILNSDNLGFAKGNNIGIEYARLNFAPEYIIVLNNDIEIIQKNFLDLIAVEHKRSNFAILAPKVLSPDGSVNQYPFTPTDEVALYKQIVLNTIKITLIKLGIYIKYLEFKNKINSSRVNVQDQSKLVRQENVVFQGSCLIFTEQYFEEYMEGFDPRTFMYKEEQLLFLRLKKGHLRTVYNPKLRVCHKTGSSTYLSAGSKKNSLLFLYTNQIKSSRVVLKELKKQEKYGT